MSDTHPPEVPGHRLERIIGGGAAGVVWAARDATGLRVAVKVPRAALDREALRQAEVERHVLTAVRHDHLVGLRDLVPLDGDRVALVFDLVEGESLRSVVCARGVLRPGETVTVVTPLAGALSALHAAGGIHGDVSAANIRLTADGRPVLLDLGSARIMGSSARLVCGTSGFIAPEVRLGADPGRPADVFALGAVAWFCLTGNGAPATDLRLDLETIESHVGPELAVVIGRCIDPDPRRRPTAGEVAEQFYAAAPAEPVDVVVGPDAASALTHRLRSGAGSEVGTDGRTREPSGRGPWWQPGPRGASALTVRARGVALVVSGLAVLGVAGALALGPGRPHLAGAPGAAAATAQRTASPGPANPSPVPPPAPSTARTGARPAGRAAASSSPTVVPSNVLADPAAPRERTAELLQALSEARAVALVGRDGLELARFCVADGPAWVADADLITTLRSSGLRWEGLHPHVATALPVEVAPSVATVRARVEWTAFTTVTSTGERTDRPADRGQALDFTLDLIGQEGTAEWRVASISPAPAS